MNELDVIFTKNVLKSRSENCLKCMLNHEIQSRSKAALDSKCEKMNFK